LSALIKGKLNPQSAQAKIRNNNAIR
jgi:hypothetical protein